MCPATCPEVGVNTQTRSAFNITGINSNAENYFISSPYKGSVMIPAKFDVLEVSFSEPFLYTPLRDPFPAKVDNANLGYVPQTLIDWMARDPDYVSKFPGIASCLPGGPSVDFFGYFCPRPQGFGGLPAQFIPQHVEQDLTIRTTVTVPGEGCFHPGACPTPVAPGATAVASAPEVTPEAEGLPKPRVSSAAQAQDGMFNMSDLQQGNYIY